MFFTALATFISLTNPHAINCATIDNSKNLASFTRVVGTSYHHYTAHYKDLGGSSLTYDTKVTIQVRQAEAALQYSKPGHKIVTVCS